MIIDVLEELNESRTESGRGSKAGREKYASKKGTKGSSVKSRKSRVKIYPSIKDALNSAAPYGTIFSTKSADRLYVISKPTWGEKSRAGGNTRIAKGFTPGAATPSAAWPSIKSHAMRTSLKHGGTHRSSRLKKKYGPGEDRPEERRHTGKKKRRTDQPNESTQVEESKKVNPWAICHAKLGKEKTAKFERCVKKVKAKHGLREKLAYLAEIAVRAESPAEKTARQKKEAMRTAEKTLRRKQAERKAGYTAHPETLKLPPPGKK